jgi:hypothetical protein
MNPERLSGIKVSYAAVPFKPVMGMFKRMNPENGVVKNLLILSLLSLEWERV